ncbi:IS5 family transposase [Nocardia noduli]|uniref:IS5 family transposase n=1 Tax=Nocardia noduli TaxID=2815722 RepID=UPI001C239675|nr:IS5 family transposase [Nocardia noduli]
MVDEVVTDALWVRLEPLIPLPQRRFRHPGRRRSSDRAALEGILFVARTGIGWNQLPTALFGASGATCWRRLAEWQEAGVWQQLHEQVLVELRSAGKLDLSIALVDASHPRALKRGDHVGPSPVDRAKPGSKHHLITDATGTPLAVTLTGGNRHDVTQLIPLLDALPTLGGRRGRPWRRPRYLYADRGYDYDKYRRQLRDRGITPVIARRGTGHGSGLGVVRWPVERSFAWLHAFKRLRIRYERRADIHQALLSLACAVICLRKLILN